MICAFKLVTNLMKGDKLGVEVNGLAESSKDQLVEADESVDNARWSVKMCNLSEFLDVLEIVPPNFNRGLYGYFYVVEGEKGLDALLGRARSETVVCGYVGKSRKKMGAAVDGRRLGSAASGMVSVNETGRVE